MKKLFQMLGVDDFQGHFEKSLHESVFHGMTQVVAWILPLQATQEKALFCPDDVIVHANLFFSLFISPLELPIDQSSLRLRAAFQERAAIFYPIDDSFFKAVAMVLIMVL